MFDKNNTINVSKIETIDTETLTEIYNSQIVKGGEFFELEETLLGSKITKEDLRLALNFYCNTPITTSDELQQYYSLKKEVWEEYRLSGSKSKVYKSLKKKFEALDLKLTPIGRQKAMEAIANKKEVTYFSNLYSNAPEYLKVDDILERIKSGEYSQLINNIRKSKSKEEKNELKKKLPVVLFNGLFYKRTGSKIIKLTDYLCLDFDDFSTFEEVSKTKEQLKSDPYVYSVFTSPKGLGLKLLLKVKRQDYNDHIRLFNGAQEYYSHIHGFDIACKDITRAAFVSYDEDLYLNKEAEEFTHRVEVNHKSKNVKKLNHEKKQKAMTKQKNETKTRKENSIFMENEIERIKELVLKYWESKYSLEDGQRNNNLFKLAIKLYSSGVPETDITNLFHERFTNIFECDDELDSIVTSACKDESVFNSTPWENYELKKNVIALLQQDDEQLKALLKEHNIDFIDSKVQKELEKLKESNQVFWHTITDKDNKVTGYKVDEYKLIEFLKSQNIFCLNNGGSFQYYIVKQNLIYELDLYDIKNIIVDYIRENQDNKTLLVSTFLKQRAIFSDLFLSDLKIEEHQVQRDSVDTVYKYFLNGVLVIYKSKQNTFINYSELDYPVYASQIIQHNYNPESKGQSDFEVFVADIAGENVDSFRSAIGYLSSNYKAQSNAKAVILSDSSTSYSEANGGRGKGILSKALSKFSKLVRIDGKRYSAQDNFALAPINRTHEIAYVDDLKQGFHFTDMYNTITDDMEVTKKYSDKEIIPFQLAPKLLLSSNYPLKGSDESSKRRRFDLTLSSYYSTKYTPIDKFGGEFFTSWNENDWNNFYHFMIGCVELFFEKGLIHMSTESMKLKELIGDTSEDFLVYIEENLEMLSSNKFSLEEVKQAYYSNSNHNISVRKIKNWLKKWCDYYSYDLKEYRENNKRVHKLMLIEEFKLLAS
ncbi:BT4734/BF3469 family protein [Olleya marilimosa]|uniref:BT4734/BF3469 family protein n=1 Tax=Olleya marilimosa TaxID=272164 RepID=UPI0004887361|nr:BT4734/BF3469 family protein [Olleya marilimosa]